MSLFKAEDVNSIMFTELSFTVALQFNSHKSVQKFFHNLHIVFSNSLMGFKVICQLEKKPLKGLADVQEILS